MAHRALNDHSSEKQSETPPALFIFSPYCRSICTYCDFNVYARREGEFEAYARAVVQEVRAVAFKIPAPRRAKSLALGGGTPSILQITQLEQIVGAVRQEFEFLPGAEWTLEANPGTVDLDKLRALRAIGFNRLSLGVQTFDNARLRAFNRAHTAQDTYDTFRWAREARFENINLDLIYGLPDQTVQDWDATLQEALGFGSEHLSLYGLQVEERTVLQKQIALGRVAEPDAELAARMYEQAAEMLRARGYLHYEISNWARPGYESQHNKTYWLNEPYLGFGAGAHSYWQGERYENVKSPREYIRRAGRGEATIAAQEIIGREMEMSETMFLGLRLGEGVGWTRFRERFGVDAREVYGEAIDTLGKTGLVKINDEGIRLTEQGMLLSNQLLWRFLPEERKI